MSKITETSYIPPFTVTDEITSLVIEIAETLGRMSVNDKDIPTPTLRKENRIKTIHSSLAIENNSLSLEQITLLLMQWKPIFAWIPVETIVKKNQQEYYSSIAQSDKTGNSTIFITFMLKCILDSLQEIEESNQKSNQKLLDAISKNPNITIRELQDFLGMSESGVKKIIRKYRETGTLVRVGGAKGGHWEIIKN